MNRFRGGAGDTAGVFAQWSKKFTGQLQREAAKELSSQEMWATSGMFVILLQTVDSQVSL